MWRQACVQPLSTAKRATSAHKEGAQDHLSRTQRSKRLSHLLVTQTFIDKLIAVTVPLPPPLTQKIIREYGHNNFLILVSCLLSLRARDVVTIHVCRDLFERIKTPQELCDMPREELERIIYRTGYYKNKARTLHEVSAALIDRFSGAVPSRREELLSLPGVGPKTASLVLGLGFGIPAICVDTHVHRISNLWGVVHTKTPEQTEVALEAALPKKYWILWNYLLVVIGQNMRNKEIEALGARP